MFFVVVLFAMSLGSHWAAERRGRSAAAWFAIRLCLTSAVYFAAQYAMAPVSGTNAIFGTTGRVAAMAVVAAGPGASLAVGLAIAWWLLQGPAVARIRRSTTMRGGYKNAEAQIWSVSATSDHLVLAQQGQPSRRLARQQIERAEVDGEYLVLKLRGEPTALELCAHGPEYPDRDQRVAIATALASRAQG